MRAFSACLAVVLGFSTCYMAACSSDSDAGGGAAGDAGESSTAGSSGKTGSSGAPGAAGATPGAAGEAPGAAGAPASDCAFTSDTCTGCLTDSCGSQESDCIGDNSCSKGLSDLLPCACDASKTTEECETAFATTGKDPATALITCFNAHCAAACSK
jgi:hypothetical protein